MGNVLYSLYHMHFIILQINYMTASQKLRYVERYLYIYNIYSTCTNGSQLPTQYKYIQAWQYHDMKLCAFLCTMCTILYFMYIYFFCPVCLPACVNYGNLMGVLLLYYYFVCSRETCNLYLYT